MFLTQFNRITKLTNKNINKMKFTKSLIFCFLTILFSVYGQAQDVAVSGKVIDENGLPIPGANILIKGTSKAVATDLDGNYQIKAESNGTLVFSFVGYNSVQEPIKGRTHIEVKLSPNSLELKEVVVTALGIKRETKALGYATQKISGESLQKVSGLDVATSLTGKVAGVLVKNSSDFAVAPEISIRGDKLTLLVVDGIAYVNKTLSDISSEDIESISVLKGATAAALYGYRGQNGAIMVTTKNGTTNKPGISADFASNTMFTAGFLAIPEKQSLYGRGANNAYDKNSDNSWGTLMDGTIRNQWDPKLMAYADYPYVASGKDNFANFLEQGYVSNNNFNIGYKGDIVSLRSSLNWTENKGQYPNSTLSKYTYTFGGDINLDKFKLSSNISYAKKHTPNMGSNGYTSYDPMYSLLIWSASDFNVLDYKDNYWLKKDEVQNYTYRSGSNNPYFDRYEKTNEVSRDLFNADLSMSYQLTDWLKATVRSGLDFYTDRGDQRISWGSYTSTGNTSTPGNPYTWNGSLTGGFITGQTQGYSINSDLLLTGETSFDKFKVEYLAGGTITRVQDDNMYGNTVGGISVPGFFSLKASVNPAFVSQTSFGSQTNSVFGRFALSYNKWIYVEATGRNDWASTMPISTQSYFYPSVSTSIVISELLPESTKSWLDLLKIRDSWTTAQKPAGIYDSTANSVFQVNSGTWNALNGATAPSSLYPTDISAEGNTTFEVGLQAMMFKNRLMFDVTYYDKNFHDAIIKGSVTAASGYTSAFVNTKEETNRRGWEIILNGSVVKNKDWQWDLGVNWSTYARYYTKLDPTYSSNKPWVKVGERVDAFVSREFLRDPASGKLIYNNGRLQSSQYDSVFGYSDPDYLWGVTSNLRYKDFSLYLSLDGVVGGLMNSRTESYMWQTGGHPDSLTPERALDVATLGSKNYIGEGVKIVSGTVTYDPVGNILTDTRVFAPNDIATTYKQGMIDLHSSSAWGGAGTRPDTFSKTFFKLREMSFTYTVPTKYLHGWAKAASIGFVGQNVFLWAKNFKYSDPDGGSEDFADPAVRYLGGNIKLTF
jgi:TonB-linked SusC/RagA family outer membrane protein